MLFSSYEHFTPACIYICNVVTEWVAVFMSHFLAHIFKIIQIESRMHENARERKMSRQRVVEWMNEWMRHTFQMEIVTEIFCNCYIPSPQHGKFSYALKNKLSLHTYSSKSNELSKPVKKSTQKTLFLHLEKKRSNNDDHHTHFTLCVSKKEIFFLRGTVTNFFTSFFTSWFSQ